MHTLITRRSAATSIGRVAAACLVVLGLAACGDDDESSDADAPSVGVIAPVDGTTVTSPVTVEMSASNFEIEPAGEVREGAGHFHIMIDVGCVEPGEVIPADDTHLHYGDGSSTVEVELTEGKHTLCIQAGDGIHTALSLTEEITVTVAPAG